MIMIVDDPLVGEEKERGRKAYLNWIAGIKFHRQIAKYYWWLSPWFAIPYCDNLLPVKKPLRLGLQASKWLVPVKGV